MATLAPARRAELAAWLRLMAVEGVGAVTARELLAALGPPEQIFALGHGALVRGAGDQLARALSATPDADAQALIERTLDWAEQPDRHLLTLADADYPQQLLTIADPPPLLWAIGNLALLAQPTIGIVGSRNATAQGIENARGFAANLAGAGLVVVSGLALGIDAAAHEGALETGTTIAVIGTGADIVYPARNRALAHRIAAGGLILSEQPLGTGVHKASFPRRNRIISGLSLGVLVVEAAAGSGSLITARQAAEQGREVFALPGSIHSALSKGCHQLIRDGAKLVDESRHILDELLPIGFAAASEPRRRGRRTGPGKPLSPATIAAGLAAAQRPAPVPDAAEPREEPPDRRDAAAGPLADHPWLTLAGVEPFTADGLAERCNASAADMLAALLDWELDGLVARLPGGFFQRLQRPA
ncbi:DNA-processing protein DprA [Derxia lacustris]|uniref:DNA-processing protein DprA n=1 Tax=Derxia lacustris TaxID=764842 RepID=UPI000A173259|nr:DNA-processing protein DprA [Derxia lacustris]